MVTREEFDQVQVILGRKNRPRRKRHEFAFTGIIRCGQCGAMVTAEEKFKLIKSTGLRKRYVYYHCSHRKDPTCRQRSITEMELMKQVDTFLARISIPKEYLDWIFKHLDQIARQEKQKTKVTEESVQKEIRKIDQRIPNLLALKISPDNADGQLLSDEEYLEQKNRLVRERFRLEARLTEGAEEAKEVIELTKETFRFAAYARFWFIKGDGKRQRTILSAVGSDHTLKDGKLAIQMSTPLRIVANCLEKGMKTDCRILSSSNSLESGKPAATLGPRAALDSAIEDLVASILSRLARRATSVKPQFMLD